MAVTTCVLHSGTETANGAATEFNIPDLLQQGTGTFLLNVTAASGTTPTLDVYIQGTWDGGTTWSDIGAYSQRTATGAVLLPVRRMVTSAGSVSSATVASTDATLGASTVNPLDLPDIIRCKWKVGGTTPSFTFSVTGVLR